MGASQKDLGLDYSTVFQYIVKYLDRASKEIEDGCEVQFFDSINDFSHVSNFLRPNHAHPVTRGQLK